MRSSSRALTSTSPGCTGGSAANSDERANAPFERADLVDHDLRGLLEEAWSRSARRATISSTVRRIGVSEFFTSWAILRASVCQLDSRVTWTSFSWPSRSCAAV